MKFVCQKSYNRKNLLIINGYIEDKEVVRERIFFEFYLGYDRKKAIKMALSITDLRAFSYALKEVAKTGKTEWKKFTESNRVKKQITLNSQYINATDGNLKIGIAFLSIHEILAIADDFTSIANEVEKELYQYQRSKNGKNAL